MKVMLLVKKFIMAKLFQKVNCIERKVYWNHNNMKRYRFMDSNQKIIFCKKSVVLDEWMDDQKLGLWIACNWLTPIIKCFIFPVIFLLFLPKFSIVFIWRFFEKMLKEVFRCMSIEDKAIVQIHIKKKFSSCPPPLHFSLSLNYVTYRS